MKFKIAFVALGIMTAAWIYSVILVATVAYPRGAPIRDWGYYGILIKAEKLSEKPTRYFTLEETDPDIAEAIAKLGQYVAVEHNSESSFLQLESIEVGGEYYRISHIWVDPPINLLQVSIIHIRAERLHEKPSIYFTLNNTDPDVTEAVAKLGHWVAVEQPHNSTFMSLPHGREPTNVEIEGEYYKIEIIAGIPLLRYERNPAIDFLMVTGTITVTSLWIILCVIARSHHKLSKKLQLVEKPH